MASRGRLEPASKLQKKGGSQKSSFVPWDYSKRPTTNDLLGKLGFGDATHGLAIAGFDKKSRKSDFADGIAIGAEKLDKAPISTYRVWDPDNFVFRVLDPVGKKGSGAKLALWGLRLSADHTNHSASRAIRSTPVIDQESTQQSAWISDLFWVTESKTQNFDREIMFNGAGFLSILYGLNAPGNNIRGQLALNVAANQGIITDGTRRGPLCHVLTFLSRGSTSRSGRPSGDSAVGLLAEAGYKYADGNIVSLPLMGGAIEADGEGDEAKKVFFFPGPAGAAFTDMALDARSNHRPISRGAFPRISAAVKLKKKDDT